MVDYLDAIRSNSARFAAAIRSTETGRLVPSCPDWDVADLTWHLAEVQHFWGTIVSDLLQDVEHYERPERPPDDQLLGFFDTASQLMVDGLERRAPDDACWSWYDHGHSVGWVSRRQAHEALIHRIDAELAAGELTTVDPALAADGVDELMTIFLDAADLPEWATFTPDGTTGRIALNDDSASWDMELGRFTGTSPASGNTYDAAAIRLASIPDQPTAIIRGTAPDLDLWLWGRGPVDPLDIAGPLSVAAHIRVAAADATQ